jgi:beta-glucosidase
MVSLLTMAAPASSPRSSALGSRVCVFKMPENGVRNTDFVSSFPSGIHVGASWNRTLAYDRANGMGHEFRKKGVHIALGPVVGPLGRLATGGRDWEGASTDPYLAGVIAGETVRGIQDAGVMTSLKVCRA